MNREQLVRHAPWTTALCLGLVGWWGVAPWEELNHSDTEGIRSMLVLQTAAHSATWPDPVEPLFEGTEPELLVLDNTLHLFYRLDRTLWSARLVQGTWQREPLTLEGFPPGDITDPDVVHLKNGQVRMYVRFVPSPNAGAPVPDPQLRSALRQEDGSWLAEPGLRFTHPVLHDPEVVQLPNSGTTYGAAGGVMEPGWKLYYGDGKQQVLSAYSGAGAQFEDEGVTILDEASSTCTIQMPGRGLWTYFTDLSGPIPRIQAAKSGGGDSFTPLKTFTHRVDLPLSLRMAGATSPTVSPGTEQLDWWMVFAIPHGGRNWPEGV